MFLITKFSLAQLHAIYCVYRDIDFVHNSLIVTGKGDKQREVYISDKAMYWLKIYINNRNGRIWREIKVHSFFFPREQR